MSVYVDELTIYPNAWGPFLKGSCHMFADENDVDALHAIALRIGMQRSWFQEDRDGGHYDLTKSKRDLAVRAGAIEVDRATSVAVWRRNREAIAKKKGGSAT